MTDSRAEALIRGLRPLEFLVTAAALGLCGTLAYVSLSEWDGAQTALAGDAVRSVVLSSFIVCGTTATLVSLLSYSIGFVCLRYAGQRSILILLPLLLCYVVSYDVLLIAWRALWAGVGDVEESTGYSWWAFVGVTTLRYVPIGALLAFLRIQELPVKTFLTAVNHGVDQWKIHAYIYCPWAAPALILIWFFTFVLTSLDTLAGAGAAGGNVQLIGNLIRDWYQSHALRGGATTIGIAYVGILSLIPLCLFRLAQRRVKAGVEMRHQLAAPTSISLIDSVLIAATSTVLVVEAVLLVILVYLAAGCEGDGCVPFVSFVFDEDIQTSAVSSIAVAILCGFVATLAAGLSAFARHLDEESHLKERSAFTGVDALMLLPLIVPPLLAALGSGLLQGQVLGRFGSHTSIVVAHSVIFGPIGYFIIRASLGDLHLSYATARNHGVRPLSYIRTVFLPGCGGAIALSFVLTSIFSLNESVVARYVGGLDRVLAVAIAEAQVAGLSAKHFQVSMALWVVTAIVLGGVYYWFGRLGKRGARA